MEPNAKQIVENVLSMNQKELAAFYRTLTPTRLALLEQLINEYEQEYLNSNP